MLLWFGSGWAANCSDAFLISCPVAASYLRSCAKEDATFEDVLIVFLLFSTWPLTLIAKIDSSNHRLHCCLLWCVVLRCLVAAVVV